YVQLQLLGPTSMIISHTLKSIGDAQNYILGEEVAQQLQPNGQAIAEATRNRDATVSSKVCGNGEHVVQVHLVGIRDFTNLEGDCWACRTSQHIEAFKRLLEVLRD